MEKEFLLVATTNRGKAREIESALASLPLRFLPLAEMKNAGAFPEDGKTFRENAAGKSLFYSRLGDFLTLAEDSGLEVERLNGEPGVYSARYAGSGADDEKNNAKVLRLMEGVPSGQRGARFVCCLVLSRKGKILAEVTESVEGHIALEKKGKGGFGYDPLFTYPPLGKTFAELDPDQKNAVSHRGRALRRMKEFLFAYLKR